MLRLHLNENLFYPGAEMYPDDTYDSIRKLLRNKLSLPESVDTIVGNGSTELISMLFLYAINRNLRIIYPWPSYILYRELRENWNADVMEVPLGPTDCEIVSSLPRIPPNSLAILCNPNNPTGQLLSDEWLSALAGSLPADSFLVIDEAYVEYTNDPAAHSLIRTVQDNPNVIVVRTFSKYYGLAGSRIGYMVLNKIRFDRFRNLLPKWNVNQAAVEKAAVALSNESQYQAAKRRLVKVRDQVVEELRSREYSVINSQTNFVTAMLPFGSAPGCMVNALPHYRDTYLNQYVRITIPDPGNDGVAQSIAQPLRDLLMK